MALLFRENSVQQIISFDSLRRHQVGFPHFKYVGWVGSSAVHWGSHWTGTCAPPICKAYGCVRVTFLWRLGRAGMVATGQRVS